MSRFLACFACVLFLCSLSGPAFADTVGTVRGNVTAGGHTVPNITVHLTGNGGVQMTVTDANGQFAFARVPFGHYALHARIGNTDAEVELDVASGSISDITLTAIPKIGETAAAIRSIRGTPVSENALSAATIAAYPRNDSLNALVETVPGIVRFSYNEPVAHGFHGLTYELDGAPLPQSTSSNFSELIDPRNISSVEIFTGAFPAEFGGSRQGAVVNIISLPPTKLKTPESTLTLGDGMYGSADARFNERFSMGSASVAFSANFSRTSRGLDTPTPNDAITHDNANLSDQFLRIVTPAGTRNTLAFDVSNQFAAFQIPINTRSNDPNNAFVSEPGTDDVQREYDRFASLSFTHTSADGLGFAQVVPWVRYSRIAYDGDLANDILATVPDPGTGLPVNQNGLRQDRTALYTGLRASVARSNDIHSIKGGIDVSRETFNDNGFFFLFSGTQQSNVVNQTGALFGAYFEDRWAIGQRIAVNAGLRYDHSTGFVGGSQLSPRFELNYAPQRATIFHAYYGRIYAAPALEDTRRDAIITQTATGSLPAYDLKPERDHYVEFGVSHTFAPGLMMYANAWQRNSSNVLDTTQLANTPLFAVFNNAIGHADGLELRVAGNNPANAFFLSASLSSALAAGVSGSTFLFDPGDVSDLTLNPEDHDQSVTINGAYTHRFGNNRSFYVTIAPQFGTGYPVTFQDGSGGRLPSHLTFDASVGREPDRATHRLGIQLAGENLTDRQYLIKVNNGFNTTQWATGRRVVLRLTSAF
jgi:outer membrane receptor protein involved in Fe transport